MGNNVLIKRAGVGKFDLMISNLQVKAERLDAVMGLCEATMEITKSQMSMATSEANKFRAEGIYHVVEGVLKIAKGEPV